jgi:hypothetical protein
VPGASCLLAGN